MIVQPHEWDKYKPFFTEKEFACKHTGRCRMQADFMDILFDIRKTYGRPMVITSGYRDPTHPVEYAKASPGEHTYGAAADIAASGMDAMDLFVIAYSYGIRRIGVQQKGRGRYLHLGIGDKDLGFPPAIWTY